MCRKPPECERSVNPALGNIQPEHWPHEYTTDLMDLLNVLGRLVLLEPQQAKLLEEILSGPLIDHASLTAAGVLQTQAGAAPPVSEEQ